MEFCVDNLTALPLRTQFSLVGKKEYNIPDGDESEGERLERLLIEEAVARRIEVPCDICLVSLVGRKPWIPDSPNNLPYRLWGEGSTLDYVSCGEKRCEPSIRSTTEG